MERHWAPFATSGIKIDEFHTVFGTERNPTGTVKYYRHRLSEWYRHKIVGRHYPWNLVTKEGYVWITFQSIENFVENIAPCRVLNLSSSRSTPTIGCGFYPWPYEIL